MVRLAAAGCATALILAGCGKSDETPRPTAQSPVEQVRTVAARWLSAVAENNGNEVCALLSSEARQRVLLAAGTLDRVYHQTLPCAQLMEISLRFVGARRAAELRKATLSDIRIAAPLATVLASTHAEAGTIRLQLTAAGWFIDRSGIPTRKARVSTGFEVPSESMAPTLLRGTILNVHAGAAPKLGAIVVFYPPAGATQEECGPAPHRVRPGGPACSKPIPTEGTAKFVKRIVAGPGDEIYIREGHVYLRSGGRGPFLRQAERYTAPCGASAECNFPTPITIPAGEWFMLGDNRGDSDDSRLWGPVPTSWILGTVSRAIAPSRTG